MRFNQPVIVGAGPAGLMLASCLAPWGYQIRIVDHRLYPTAAGRADAIQPHSLEVLENMGLKGAIMAHNPARLFETCFWVTGAANEGVVRSATAPSCPDHVDTRYKFQTLLHQGRIEQCFIEYLERRNIKVDRPWTMTSFEPSHIHPEYPLLARLAHVDGIASEGVLTKYIFSAEGVKSSIRRSLKIDFQYMEPPTHIWGVVDGIVRSDFPDIMMACSIRTAKGSAMIIPRENGMIRFYVQIANASDADWDPHRSATATEIQTIAKSVISPYHIEWDYVEWSSSYQIRQGIADCWSRDQRVFLGGDAAHAFSPKLGQGMNTAFMDAQNLAWKIHAVESNFAHREILKTYETERRTIATTLVQFDNPYANLYSSTPKYREQPQQQANGEPQVAESDIWKPYGDSRAFVSGHGFRYGPNMLTWSPEHPAKSDCFHASTNLLAGQLFIKADLIRVIDSDRVYLEQAVPSNGSFRIVIFAGKPSESCTRLQDLSNNLLKHGFFFTNTQGKCKVNSQMGRHNPHSQMYTFCIIFDAARTEVDMSKHIPGIFKSYQYHVYVDQGSAAYVKAGIHSDAPVMVITRPDSYVGAILKLVEGPGPADALAQYFLALRYPMVK